MTYIEDLETAVVAQIKAQVSSLAWCEAASAVGDKDPTTPPAALVSCEGFQAVELRYENLQQHIRGIETFIVAVFATSGADGTGAARLGSTGAYSYGEQIRAALMGFTPTLASTGGNTFPIEYKGRRLFVTEQGKYGAVYTFSAELWVTQGIA